MASQPGRRLQKPRPNPSASCLSDIVRGCDPDHFCKPELPLLIRYYCEAAVMAEQAALGAVIKGKPSPWLVIQEKNVRAPDCVEFASAPVAAVELDAKLSRVTRRKIISRPLGTWRSDMPKRSSLQATARAGQCGHHGRYFPQRGLGHKVRVDEANLHKAADKS